MGACPTEPDWLGPREDRDWGLLASIGNDLWSGAVGAPPVRENVQ
jgi:hypothetical protein